MTDRPILFSAPMIRALLDDRKSQTRRVLKPQPSDYQRMTEPTTPRAKTHEKPYFDAYNGGPYWCWWDEWDRQGPDWIKIPYAVGDRLWCREAWDTALVYDDLPPSDLSGEEAIGYYADGACETWGWEPKPVDWGKLRPSIFMPRWASRITLTVTDVRVQRVQEISVADCIAEGIDHDADEEELAMIQHMPSGEYGDDRHKETYADLWDSLNAKRGFGWDENPWVAAYSFSVHKGNIDMETEG